MPPAMPESCAPILILLNPGARRGDLEAEILARAAEIPGTMIRTGRRPGYLRELAEKAAGEGFGTVVAGGEPVATATGWRFEIRPQALEVVVPAAAGRPSLA